MKKDTRFLYDGWNVIAEFDASPSLPVSGSPRLAASYAWGLDLSGTETGAGGVGGLLFAKLYPTTFNNSSTTVQPPSTAPLAPLYDGNGNILAYVDCATGQTLARYEFDPFGKLLLKDENTRVAGRLHHQFSTKFTDDETGLSYYGYRYYSPDLGRWVSRDPIGERGGVHQYGFLANNGISGTDVNGLCGCICVIPPDPNEECWEQFMKLPPQEQWNHTCCGGQLRLKYGYRFSWEAISDFETKGIHRAGQCIDDVWYVGDLGDPSVPNASPGPDIDFGLGAIGAAGVVGAELGTDGFSTSLSPPKLSSGVGGVAGITATATFGEPSGYGFCISGGGGDGLGGAFSLTFSQGGASLALYGGVGVGGFISAGGCHVGP